MKKPQSKIRKVIGIGASAGGLDAIQHLFDNIPPDTDNAFVIIQHLSPDFKSLMPELLAKHTEMPIFTTEDKQKILPNCIYLNQSTRNLHIKGDTLYLLDKGPKSNVNLPIDIFFHTLGEEFKENSIGIILSGTGSDGSRGIKSIKEAGGLLFVQSPDTAQFDGMPNASIATRLIDFILPASKIGEAVSKYSSTELNSLLSSPDASISYDEIFSKILMEIQKYSGLDLKQYKDNTLHRRLEKRLNINNVDTLNEYLSILETSENEKKFLYQDFLIGVTSFFRDKEAFDFLKSDVLPSLCDPESHINPIRVWIPGCSTGEEAYSIAIIIDEYITSHNIDLQFKIFATDINEANLQRANQGLFHINSSEEIDEQSLKKYFIKTGDQIQIVKHIRDKIVFSSHNILNDPPFIRMDLICCRNLLIYLENEAQRKVIGHILFSLNKDGFLFLGNSETVGKYENDLEVLSSKWKIFKNISNTHNRPADLSTEIKTDTIFKYKGIKDYPIVPKRESEIQYYKYISDKYSPSLIFIDKDFNILFLKGNVGEKLSPREGLFQQNIIQLVEPSLASVIRNGVRRAKTEQKPILIKDVLIQTRGSEIVTNLTFELTNQFGVDRDIYIIEYGEDRKITEEAIEIQNINLSDTAAQRIEDLEYELRIKNEELRNVIEELETANEELQSANEELMASNEELQSTNEELQSVNEELFTVNTELQEKNKELADVNDVINNLINATDIATLFLDKELKIKKFTNSLKRNLALEPSDIGRSISSFSFNFSHTISQIIIGESERCLETKRPFEKQITDKDESSFLLRINPFFNHYDTIDGVVITLVDVTELMSTREELRLMEDKYANLFKNISVGVIHGEIISDTDGKPADLKLISINPEFETQIGKTSIEVIGNKLSTTLQDPEVKTIIKILDKSSKSGIPYNMRYYSPSINKHYIVRSFRPKKGECAATFEDITELLHGKEILRKTIERLNLAIDLTDTAIWEWDVKSNKVTDSNDHWRTIYNLNTEDVTESFDQYIFADDRKKVWDEINALIDGKVSKYHQIFRYEDPKTQRLKWIENVGQTFKRDNSGNISTVLGVSRDITTEREAYLKLEEEKDFSVSITENATSGIYIYDLKEGANTYMNNRYSEILGWTMDEINKMDAVTFFNLFHPDDQEAVKKHMDVIISEKKEDSISYQFKHKDGNWVKCFSVDSPLEFNEDGTVKSFIGSFIDLKNLE